MNRRHDSDDMLAAGKSADRGFRQPQRSCHGVYSKKSDGISLSWTAVFHGFWLSSITPAFLPRLKSFSGIV